VKARLYSAIVVIILGSIEYGVWNGIAGSAIGNGLLVGLAIPLLYFLGTFLFGGGEIAFGLRRPPTGR
jgi:hypothetical protein